MSKIETVRRLTEQSDKTIREQVKELRQLQTGTLPELAAKIEPLAQAMAALTDETKETLEKAKLAFESQAQESRKRQWELLENAEETIKHLKTETEDTIGRLKMQIDLTKTSIRNWSLKTWMAISLVAVIAAAPSGYLIWRLQHQPDPAIYERAVKAISENEKWVRMYQESPEKTREWIERWWQTAP